MACWHLKTVSILPEDFFEKLSEGVFVTTADGKYEHCNNRLVEIYRYDSKEDLKSQLTDIAGSLYVDKNRRSEFQNIMAQYGRVDNFESQVRCKDGSTIWIRENAWAVHDQNNQNIIGYSGTVTDITEQKILEQQIYFDVLTGLPRRPKFENDFKQRLLNPNQKFGLVLIEIENYKLLKDRYRQVVMDHLVLTIKDFLISHSAGVVQIARIEQDQFVCLFESPKKIEMSTFTKKITDLFKNSFKYKDSEIPLSCHVGLFLDEGAHTLDASQILTLTQSACRQAEKMGSNKHAFYDEQLEKENLRKERLTKELGQAIEDEGLTLFYQPKYNVKYKKITGAEALGRWQTRDGEWIPPSEFISIAEETGLIYPLGQYFFKRALKTLRSWQEKKWALSMAVNVSAPQFFQDNFVSNLFETIRHTDADPKYLKLEITENMEIKKSEIAKINNTTSELQEVGIGISLDDFGTGRSNLIYIPELNFDEIKIDQSFVQKNPYLKGQERYDILVRTIMDLARKMNVPVVGEGAETKEQADYLIKLGCKEIQGYYYHRPMSEENIERLLKNSQ